MRWDTRWPRQTKQDLTNSNVASMALTSRTRSLRIEVSFSFPTPMRTSVPPGNPSTNLWTRFRVESRENRFGLIGQLVHEPVHRPGTNMCNLGCMGMSVGQTLNIHQHLKPRHSSFCLTDGCCKFCTAVQSNLDPTGEMRRHNLQGCWVSTHSSAWVSTSLANWAFLLP